MPRSAPLAVVAVLLLLLHGTHAGAEATPSAVPEANTEVAPETATSAVVASDGGAAGDPAPKTSANTTTAMTKGQQTTEPSSPSPANSTEAAPTAAKEAVVLPSAPNTSLEAVATATNQTLPPQPPEAEVESGESLVGVAWQYLDDNGWQEFERQSMQRLERGWKALLPPRPAPTPPDPAQGVDTARDLTRAYVGRRRTKRQNSRRLVCSTRYPPAASIPVCVPVYSPHGAPSRAEGWVIWPATGGGGYGGGGGVPPS